MKTKLILLLIAFLLVRHISFADGFRDKIVNSPNVYFQLTGNSEIDNLLQSAFENYWKVNHFVVIPANTSKKDITITGKAPVFLFLNSDEFNNIPGYVDCISIIWGNAGTFSKSKIGENQVELMRENLFVPSYKMNLLDIDFLIPLAIKEMNDDLMCYKAHKTWTGNPSILKDKTLLIPQEMTEPKMQRKNDPIALPVANLAGYKFKYKIMPTSQIKTIANDSSENSQYCYITVSSGIEIYDLATKNRLIQVFSKGGVQIGLGALVKQSDMEKISDEIATAPTPRKKE